MKQRNKKPKDLDERYYYCFKCYKNDRLKLCEIENNEMYNFYCMRCFMIIGDFIDENRIMNIPSMNESDHFIKSWALSPNKWKNYYIYWDGKKCPWKYWIDNKGNLKKEMMSKKDMEQWRIDMKKRDKKEDDDEEMSDEGEDYEN